MILQLSSPCMEHTKKAGQITADVLRIVCHCFEGIRGCTEKGCIALSLVAADEAAKLLRYCKGDHKMVSGQLPLHPLFQPLSGFVVLAGGAMAIAAASEDPMTTAALFAPINQKAAVASSAVNDGIDGFFVLSGHLSSVS